MVQVEITTKCNLTCFYCVGRHLPQKNMELSEFEEVLKRVPPRSVVHLQGEGEPLLHPNIREMIALCREAGYRVTTTTNGTIPFDISLVDKLHVSIDTLDADQNQKSGRDHFDKTMANVMKWIEKDKNKLLIRTTDYGQDISGVMAFSAEHKVNIMVQKLNQKEDYGICYIVEPMHIEETRVPSCSIVQSGDRYFNVDGMMLPCCFIKFPKETYEEIHHKFDQGQIPSSCTGCRNLRFTSKRKP